MATWRQPGLSWRLAAATAVRGRLAADRVVTGRRVEQLQSEHDDVAAASVTRTPMTSTT